MEFFQQNWVFCSDSTAGTQLEGTKSYDSWSQKGHQALISTAVGPQLSLVWYTGCLECWNKAEAKETKGRPTEARTAHVIYWPRNDPDIAMRFKAKAAQRKLLCGQGLIHMTNTGGIHQIEIMFKVKSCLHDQQQCINQIYIPAQDVTRNQK